MDAGERDGDGGRRAWILAVPVVTLAMAGLAAPLAPVLVRDHPLLLLVLQTNLPYVLLVSGKVGAAPLLLVAVARLLAANVGWFFFGRWYGDRAVDWTRARGPGARTVVDTLAGMLTRLRDPLVLLFMNPAVGVVAGATGMRPRRYLLLRTTGVVATVLAWRVAAARAPAQLAQAVRFVELYATRLTLVLLVAAVVLAWLRRAAPRGRRSPPSA
ncbi:MAG TPA: hypothetical protein VG276_12475 [Actinomycetes bacterium]|jgi:membrane protein DedA with SNARE-associated domain|nr:hypothetical protein [Actinomycetes bacterium]